MSKESEYTIRKCIDQYDDGPTNAGEWMRPTQAISNFTTTHEGLAIQYSSNISTVSRACSNATDCFPPSYDGQFLDNMTMGFLVSCAPTGAQVPVIDVALRQHGWEGIDRNILEDPCRIVETDLPTCRCGRRTSGVDCATMAGFGTLGLVWSLMAMLFIVAQFIQTIVRLKRLRLRKASREPYAYRLRLAMLLLTIVYNTACMVWNVGFILDMAFPLQMATLGPRIVRFITYPSGVIASGCVQILTLVVALHFVRTVANQKNLSVLMAGSLKRMARTTAILGITYFPTLFFCMVYFGLWMASVISFLFLMLSVVLLSVGNAVLRRTMMILTHDLSYDEQSKDIQATTKSLHRSMRRIILMIVLQMIGTVCSVVIFADEPFYVVPYATSHMVTVVLTELLWKVINPREDRKISPRSTIKVHQTISSVGTLGS